MKSLYFDNNLARIALHKVASVVTKRAALSPLGFVQYKDVREPVLPNEKWLKVRNQRCGLCGTDIHFFFFDMAPKCFPASIPGVERKFLGHEAVGFVTEVGGQVHGFSTGDRVALRMDWPSCFQLEIDPPCPQCQAKNHMLCENLGKKNLPEKNVGGGFSPYMVAHQSQLFKIPDNLSDDRAVLLEPTACALHTVKKHEPSPGDQVLVIGAGTIGLLTLAVAKSLAPEAQITVLARYPFQQEAAKRLGADFVIQDGPDLFSRMAAHTKAKYWKGLLGHEILLGGFDVIYDTIGSDATVQNSLYWAKGKGHVVLSGINFHPGNLDYSPIWCQELHVTGINCHAFETPDESTFDLAADLLGQMSFPVESIITHRFAVDQYKDAIGLFLTKKGTQAIKIVLEHTS